MLKIDQNYPEKNSHNDGTYTSSEHDKSICKLSHQSY